MHEKEFLNQLGQRIKSARKKAGLYQQQFADLLEIDRSGLSHIEQGYNSPNILTIKKMADALKMDIKDFF